MSTKAKFDGFVNTKILFINTDLIYHLMGVFEMLISEINFIAKFSNKTWVRESKKK